MTDRSFSLAPIVGPIVRLLGSRKFMVAVLTILVDVLVAYIPALEAARSELLTVLTVIGTALVAAIAYEDGQSRKAA